MNLAAARQRGAGTGKILGRNALRLSGGKDPVISVKNEVENGGEEGRIARCRAYLSLIDTGRALKCIQ
jgi:hypothetical protein